MQVDINITIPTRFVEESSDYYSPEEWVSIIITDLKELNLPMSEEYQIGIHSFGDCISLEYNDQLAYVLNAYIKYKSFTDRFDVIMFLFHRAI
jgi:hypothetical protein